VNCAQRVSELGGRILLSVLFLLSGLGKIGAYAGTSAYMSSLGVPGALLPDGKWRRPVEHRSPNRQLTTRLLRTQSFRLRHWHRC
jgi:DoxX